MGVRFLSEEWAKALGDALNNFEPFREAAAGQEVRLQQVVTNVPDAGDVLYYMQFSDGRVETGAGEMADAESTITQSYETAQAVSKGELDGSQAFMQGKIKASGDLMKVMGLTGVFATINEAAKDIAVDYI